MSSFTYRPRYRYALSSRQRNRSTSRYTFTRSQRRAYMPRRFGSAVPNALYKTSMPRQMKVCMKYVDHYQVTTGAAQASGRVMRLNSIFDPDLTGTGHQPQSHDNWNTLYQTYRVDKASVTLKVPEVAVGGYVYLLTSNSPTFNTDPVVAAESPFVVGKAIQAGGPSVTLYSDFDIAKTFGYSRAQFDADVLTQSAFGASPTRLQYLHIVFVDAALGASIFNYSVEIKYYCTLMEPLPLDRQ